MPNIAAVIKEEIARVARKQIRAETEHLKKQVAQHRSQIAELKRRLTAAEKQSHKTDRAAAAVAPTQAEGESSSLRFRAAGFAAHRARLGLSAREMGLLLGASPLSVYKWEQGKVKPRAAQLASIAQVRKLGKREAAEKLSGLQA
jgi:DNA-binding transcriptional regulator YiaG